ncbi:IclR family transcriptional regulator [Haloarculaceae archaeon H-GB11]|nr:IclR family transcriptional regulator [Haloarculaceae archaeon H-GB11]
MTDPDARTLSTTETSLAIVEAIDEMGGARMRDIAEELDMPTSTVHVHLRTLIQGEFVVKRGEVYHLALHLFHLGEQARQRDQRFDLAQEKAHELADQCNEEVSFAVEEYGRAIILYNIVSDPSVAGFQVGRYFYMHNSAVGKAMLAAMDDERVAEIVDRRGLPQVTDNTITDRAALFAELDRTRERGYAVNDQEALDGLRAVGVPATDPQGEVLGAFDISGPPYRLPDDDELATMLTAAVEELEADIASANPF